MSGIVPIASLLVVSTTIGAVHMLAPDHWVPLSIYCHAKGISARRAALIAAAGGLAHVAGSLVAMLAALVVGFAVISGFSSLSNYVVGISFVAVGLWMFVSGLRAPEVEREKIDISRGTKWIVLATASTPELTIFPVYLAASVYGLFAVTVSLAAFTLGTVVSIMLVTLAGVKGLGAFLKAPGRERQIDFVIALFLIGLGAFILVIG